MTRLLFLGDSAGTGFGSVTAGLGAALIEKGVDVRFLSLNEQPTGELEPPFAGRTAMLGDADGWLSGGLFLRAREAMRMGVRLEPDEEERLARLTAQYEGMFTGALFDDGWTPEAAIVLGDVGSLEISPILDFLPAGFPAWHYVPIEGVGAPPAWGRLWQKLTPVACSEFGADVIAHVTGRRPPVVYHGVSRDFWPVSPFRPLVMPLQDRKSGLPIVRKLRSREDCRDFLALPRDAVVLFRADRLMLRKNYAALLRAVAPILAQRPNVMLVLHCRVKDEGGNLEWELSKYPPAIRSRMLVTGIGGQADHRLLCAMYNAANLYVTTSAEGFGLTIAESLACGVPAVGLDYSSVPEVIGPAGAVVDCDLYDNMYSQFWARPNEAAFTAAVDALLADPARRSVLGQEGPPRVRKLFDWPDKADQFIALISGAVRAEVAA